MESEHIVSVADPSRFPASSLPEIAFLGRSNVGKSSLINCLTGRKGLAFTSSRPGCTQVINFYRVPSHRGGEDNGWHFVDLPGYGFAQVPVDVKARWKRLIESYLLDRRALELTIVLLDARRGWMEQDLELKRWLEFHNQNFLVVATKMDKLNQRDQNRSLAGIRQELADSETLCPFSAVTGRGVREIWQAISTTKNRQ
jgi:GTP-binding protein